MGHVANTRPEKQQVTGLERCPRRHERTGVVLTLGGPWDRDSGGGVRDLGQARAVESRVTVSAPDVRLADLPAGKDYRRQGPALLN